MSPSLSLHCNELPEGVVVAALRGFEAISAPYAIEIHLLAAEGTTSADLDRAVGAAATLRVGDDDVYARSGVLVTIERTGRAGMQPLFCATLVPRFWLLTQSLHSRIFTDATLPEIVEDVLRRGGLTPEDYELRLGADQPRLEHVCQYRESDFELISRWLEREGLYYFFEQQPGGERLVITDDRSCQRRFTESAVRFSDGADDPGERVRSIRRKRRVLPRAVTLGDVDYLHPGAPARGQATIAGGTVGELRDHRAGVFDDARGARIALRRAEQLGSTQTEYRVDATSRALRSGYFFRLEGHPESDFDAEYLVTRIDFEAVAPSTPPEVRRTLGFDLQLDHRADATAIPSTVQFRAACTTPWPRVSGHEIGVVDGPADGDHAQIDEHGRYKVKLQLDETDRSNGRASTWIRMMQPHAGTPEGFHFPLRKGTEVLLTFLGGDPDRPVIAGAVPNATRPSPVTRDNAASNVIHTAGGNHVELGDTRGAEFLRLATPHENTRIHLGWSESGNVTLSFETGGDREEETGGDKDEEVHGNVTELIHGSKAETILGFETGTILGLKTEQVGGGEIKTVVGAVVDSTIGLEDKNVIGGEVKVVLGLLPIASQINILGIDNKNVLGADISNVLGAEMKFVGGGVQETIVGGVVEVVIGGKSETLVGAEVKTVLGGAVELVAGLEEKIVIGGAVEVVAPIDMKMVIGAVLDLVVGVDVGMVVGVKVEEIAGIAFSNAETVIEETETKLAIAEDVVIDTGVAAIKQYASILFS